jgi:hypothetical protein
MKNQLLLILSIAAILFYGSCAKEPGIGGNATIRGKVYAKHYNTTFTVLLSEYYMPDTYVYIVFGNDINYGTRIKTNYDGEFEFNYLYEGDYTIYTYSIDSAAIVNFAVAPPDSAVIQTVLLNKNDAVVELEDLVVFK